MTVGIWRRVPDRDRCQDDYTATIVDETIHNGGWLLLSRLCRHYQARFALRGGCVFSRIPVVAIAFFALWIGWAGAASAEADAPATDILKTLTFRAGTIPLGDNLATVALGKSYRFLNNLDTQTFLTKFYSNPPGTGRDALGLIIPNDVDPLDPDAWVAVIAYDASGYVSDADASSINYDELLSQMQADTAKSNEQRKAQGYQTIELVGWAQKPYYDAQAKKLYWAKRLRFGDSQAETLNYQIRILGRNGVLEMTIVAGMEALPTINHSVAGILQMVQFNKGNTYAEYNSSIDKTAAYGIAGLVAGGVLAKVGFFKALLLLLGASGKFIGVAVLGACAAVWAFIKNLFTRRSKAPRSNL